MNIASTQADLLTPLCGPASTPASSVEPAFAFPEPHSVRARILAALLRGEALTQADALRRWSTSRLASAIYQLRGFGWPIMTVPIPVQTRDNGRTATVARYRLPSFAIQQAGERGRNFVAEAARYERGPKR